MDNVILRKDGKTTTSSVDDAMQRMEDEGGIAITPPPEPQPAIRNGIIKRFKRMFTTTLREMLCLRPTANKLEGAKDIPLSVAEKPGFEPDSEIQANLREAEIESFYPDSINPENKRK